VKALVIDDFVRRGGGQVYGLALADALANIGYDVYLLTNTEAIENRKVAFRVRYEFSEGDHGIINFLKVMNLKRQLSKIDLGNFSLVINNHPNIFITKGDVNILHGFSFLDPWINDHGDLIESLPPTFIRLAHLYDQYEGSLFIPNSNYTSLISKKLFRYLGIEANIGRVLCPPVHFDKYTKEEKKEQVLVLGRINKDKRLEEVIEVANAAGFRLEIAGYLNKGDESYLSTLKRKTAKNININPNVTEELKRRLIMESSTILNVNGKENFGISIAEGMSKGCVPIVRKSGAPWIDIIEEGKYGLGFRDYEEIPKLG
jgi:glycosyltransferase involved in cell wall biosynthesis